ncbi:MAG: transcriptional regulator [bacterium]|nr:transcriptional regulator [bacterium]
MSEPFKQIAELDRLVHDSSRLAILTALAACTSADFLYLARLTGLSKGNLSSHLSKLEAGGLLVITKQFIGKKPNTLVSLTSEGRRAIEKHWEELGRLRREVGGGKDE